MHLCSPGHKVVYGVMGNLSEKWGGFPANSRIFLRAKLDGGRKASFSGLVVCPRTREITSVKVPASVIKSPRVYRFSTRSHYARVLNGCKVQGKDNFILHDEMIAQRMRQMICLAKAKETPSPVSLK